MADYNTVNQQQQQKQQNQPLSLNFEHSRRSQNSHTLPSSPTQIYCVSCFSNLQDFPTSYQIRKSLNFQLLENSCWDCRSQICLMNGLKQWGFGNWGQIKEHMDYNGCVFKLEDIQSHYEQLYLRKQIPEIPESLTYDQSDHLNIIQQPTTIDGLNRAYYFDSIKQNSGSRGVNDNQKYYYCQKKKSNNNSNNNNNNNKISSNNSNNLKINSIIISECAQNNGDNNNHNHNQNNNSISISSHNPFKRDKPSSSYDKQQQRIEPGNQSSDSEIDIDEIDRQMEQLRQSHRQQLQERKQAQKHKQNNLQQKQPNIQNINDNNQLQIKASNSSSSSDSENDDSDDDEDVQEDNGGNGKDNNIRRRRDNKGNNNEANNNNNNQNLKNHHNQNSNNNEVQLKPKLSFSYKPSLTGSKSLSRQQSNINNQNNNKQTTTSHTTYKHRELKGQNVYSYNPKRKQFESIQYDCYAQSMLALLQFHQDEQPEQRDLKLKVIEQYNKRLDGRMRRRQFVIEHRLLEGDFQTKLQKEFKRTKSLEVFRKYFQRDQDYFGVLRVLVKEMKLKSLLEAMRLMRRKFKKQEKKRGNEKGSYQKRTIQEMCQYVRAKKEKKLLLLGGERGHRHSNSRKVYLKDHTSKKLIMTNHIVPNYSQANTIVTGNTSNILVNNNLNNSSNNSHAGSRYLNLLNSHQQQSNNPNSTNNNNNRIVSFNLAASEIDYIQKKLKHSSSSLFMLGNVSGDSRDSDTNNNDSGGFEIGDYRVKRLYCRQNGSNNDKSTSINNINNKNKA